MHRELLDYIAKLVDLRSAEPKNDLISKLVVEQLKPGHIEKSDAVQIAFLLLVAGNATMVNMIALVCFDACIAAYNKLTRVKGVVTLAQNPKQLEELVADPSLVHSFIAELCRYHTGSAMAMKRVAKEDIELGGKVRT